MEELASLSRVGIFGIFDQEEQINEVNLADGLVKSTLTLERQVLSNWEEVQAMVSDRLSDLFIIVNDQISVFVVALTYFEGYILEPTIIYGFIFVGLIGGIILLINNAMTIHQERHIRKKQVVVEKVKPFWDAGHP